MSPWGKCNFKFLKNSQLQINPKLNEKTVRLILLIIRHEKIYGLMRPMAQRGPMMKKIAKRKLRSYCKTGREHLTQI